MVKAQAGAKGAGTRGVSLEKWDVTVIMTPAVVPCVQQTECVSAQANARGAGAARRQPEARLAALRRYLPAEVVLRRCHFDI